MPGFASLPATRKSLILVVIDGLTPAMFESAVESARTPALAFLAEQGRYGRAVSTFPSLTPVCLSSIATGAHPDVHRIPHLVWYHRAERRFVEYGSSFGAMRVAGTRRSITDAIFDMNQLHLGAEAVTVYEALEDAGLTTAAINITCYRGRTRHLPVVPGLQRATYGPKRFFYFNLFESDVTGAPVAVRTRARGSVDAYAAAVGRWLVTRDGFDFLAYYLPDYDFASHVAGPDAAHEALERTDRAVAALMDAAGGWEEFLERYAVLLCADHGQTRVERAVRLEDAFADLRLFRRGGKNGAQLATAASNRAGMVYRLPGCPLEARTLAERLDREPAAEVVLFLEGDSAVARRDGEELRCAPAAKRPVRGSGPGERGNREVPPVDADPAWRTSGDRAVLDYPNGLERAWAALRNPNAGELIVSAAPGFEFADLAGRHHVGGGSHGSLDLGDSEVPVLTVGLDPEPRSITDLAPLVLAHFGVDAPRYASGDHGARAA